VRNKKIEKAVEECVTAMSELTIEESKAARVYLDHALESMYKRSPDTILGAIQPPS
jgi:bacterioferritin-associated ferredoxin